MSATATTCKPASAPDTLADDATARDRTVLTRVGYRSVTNANNRKTGVETIALDEPQQRDAVVGGWLHS